MPLSLQARERWAIYFILIAAAIAVPIMVFVPEHFVGALFGLCFSWLCAATFADPMPKGSYGKRVGKELHEHIQQNRQERSRVVRTLRWASWIMIVVLAILIFSGKAQASAPSTQRQAHLEGAGWHWSCPASTGPIDRLTASSS